MGINDRDYMKAPDDDVIQLSDILMGATKFIVMCIALAFSLRIPVIWIKIPIAIAVLFLGLRWIFNVKKAKKKKKAPTKPTAPPKASIVTSKSSIEKLEAEGPPKPDQNAVRLLIAYDAAGKFGQAKTLIQQLDGQEFSESVGKEFAVLARNYFPVELEPTDQGVRLRLA